MLLLKLKAAHVVIIPSLSASRASNRKQGRASEWDQCICCPAPTRPWRHGPSHLILVKWLTGDNCKSKQCILAGARFPQRSPGLELRCIGTNCMAACMAVRLVGIAQMRTIVAQLTIPHSSQLTATATAHSPARSPTPRPHLFSHSGPAKPDCAKLECMKSIRPVTACLASSTVSMVGAEERGQVLPRRQVWLW